MAAANESEPDSGGVRPKLGWLPVARLVVDPSYQRSIDGFRSRRLIDRIVIKFNWSAFQAIVVTEAGENWNIIDGQHRVEAARRRKEPHVPAVIVASLTPAEQAAIFVTANQNRVAVNATALHHAAVTSGDVSAVAIQRAVAAAGLEVPAQQVMASRLQPGQIAAVPTLYKLMKRYGEEMTMATLKVVSCYRDHQHFMRSTLLEAVGSLLCDDVTAAALTAVLQNRGPEGLFNDIDAYREQFEVSAIMAAEAAIKKALKLPLPASVRRPVVTAVVETPRPQNRARGGLDEPRSVTLGDLGPDERLQKMISDGAPMARIVSALGLTPAEIKSRAAALQQARRAELR